MVYFRTRTHVGIIPDEQTSRDLHQRLSEPFLLEHAGILNILTGSHLEDEQDGDTVIMRDEQFSDERLTDGEWKTIYYSSSRLGGSLDSTSASEIFGK